MTDRQWAEYSLGFLGGKNSSKIKSLCTDVIAEMNNQRFQLQATQDDKMWEVNKIRGTNTWKKLSKEEALDIIQKADDLSRDKGMMEDRMNNAINKIVEGFLLAESSITFCTRTENNI